MTSHLDFSCIYSIFCMTVTCENNKSELFFLSIIFGFWLGFYWNRYYWVRVLYVNWKIVSLPNLASKLFSKSSTFKIIFGLPWNLSLKMWCHFGKCNVLGKKVRNCLDLYLLNFAILFLSVIVLFWYIWPWVGMVGLPVGRGLLFCVFFFFFFFTDFFLFWRN